MRSGLAAGLKPRPPAEPWIANGVRSPGVSQEAAAFSRAMCVDRPSSTADRRCAGSAVRMNLSPRKYDSRCSKGRPSASKVVCSMRSTGEPGGTSSRSRVARRDTTRPATAAAPASGRSRTRGRASRRASGRSGSPRAGPGHRRDGEVDGLDGDRRVVGIAQPLEQHHLFAGLQLQGRRRRRRRRERSRIAAPAPRVPCRAPARPVRRTRADEPACGLLAPLT